MKKDRGTLRFVGIIGLMALLAGCDNGAAPPQVVVTDAGDLQDLSDASGCSHVAEIPGGDLAAVDTSATPRDNREAEILALEASGEFMAPEDLYQRVVAELAALRAGWPGDTRPTVVPCGPPEKLLINMTEQGTQQAADGTYHDWDDYNRALRVVDTEVHVGSSDAFSFVELTFAGRYNILSVGNAYDRLPEIEYAVYDLFGGDGSDVCLEHEADDSDLYIFYTGSGDCPAGCTERSYAGFRVQSDGIAEFLGRYDPSAGAAPPWFNSAAACRAFFR